MSPAETMTAAARELTPLLRARRPWSESNCRMAREVHEALAQAGLFRMTAPAELGGAELDLVSELVVYEELAFADPSAAWIVVNSNAAGRFAVRLDERTARDVFADPTASYGIGLPPLGRATPCKSAYRVSGRWPVVSGCEDAKWFLLVSLVYDKDQPRSLSGRQDIRLAIVPASSVRVVKTWSDAIALRGSGSHAVETSECLVPGRMIRPITSPLRVDRPLYHVPIFAWQSLALAAIVLGLARAANESIAEQAQRRVSAATGARWRDWPGVQDSVASADCAVLCARAGLLDVVGHIWEGLKCSQGIAPLWHARTHAMADHAIRTACEAVSRTFACGSIDVLHSGHALEQSLRDVHAFSVQWERYRRLHYEAGRVLLGGAPADPLF